MDKLKLDLPEPSIFNQFMPKKQFYEHGKFNQTEKNIFINSIERIILYSQLTRDITNIDVYKYDEKTYEEISIFIVQLRDNLNMDRIANSIMSNIPYPMILVGKHKEKYIFYGSHQRDNKLDKDKIILDNIYNTGFINKDSNFIKNINYKNLSKVNFYEFYNDYIDAIINLNLEKRNIKQVKNKEDILNRVEELEEEIRILKNKKIREKQFNRKMDLNIKIKNIEKELKQMED